MIKRSFYFLRHGETVENANGILEGHIDTVLNERGRYQAQGAIEVLRHHSVDRIVCSPLKRAVETAEIINKVLQKPLIFDERLQEKSFGLFEGRTSAQIEQWKKSMISSMVRSSRKPVIPFRRRGKPIALFATVSSAALPIT